MDRHFPHQPERVSGPRPLPDPGLGIAVINEREGLGDGFYKLPLLRALKRAYPAEKITWAIPEGDSPYRITMAEIVRPSSLRPHDVRVCVRGRHSVKPEAAIRPSRRIVPGGGGASHGLRGELRGVRSGSTTKGGTSARC